MADRERYSHKDREQGRVPNTTFRKTGRGGHGEGCTSMVRGAYLVDNGYTLNMWQIV